MKSLIIITLLVLVLYILTGCSIWEDFFPLLIISVGFWIIWKLFIFIARLLFPNKELQEDTIRLKKDEIYHKSQQCHSDMRKWHSNLKELLLKKIVKKSQKTQSIQASLDTADRLNEDLRLLKGQLEDCLHDQTDGFFERSRRRTLIFRYYKKYSKAVKSILTIHRKLSSQGRKYSQAYEKMCHEKKVFEKNESQRLSIEREQEYERNRLAQERTKLEHERMQTIEKEKIKACAEKERAVALKEKDLEILKEKNKADAFLKEKEQETTKMMLEIERLKASKSQAEKERFERLKSLLDD